MKVPTPHQCIGNRIACKLVWRVVLFSSLVTLLATLLQLYLDFHKDVTEIKSSMKDIQEVHQKSIAQSVWILDDLQVNLQLDGIIHRQDFVYAAVAMDGVVVWEKGEYSADNTMQAEYPLYYTNRGRNEEIGILSVTASLDEVYGRLLRRVVVILLSNAVKTFLVAGFILLIFQHLVTKHLGKMASFVRHLEIDHPQTPLKLDRDRFSQNDELDDVVAMVNTMQQRGYQAYASLQESEQRLRMFFDSSEEGIFGVGRGGRCTFMNASCVAHFALANEQNALGKHIRQLLPLIDRDCSGHKSLEEMIRTTINEKQPVFSEEQRIYLNNRTCSTLSLRSYPLVSNNQCNGAIVFFTDISRQQKLRYEKHLLAEVIRQSPLVVIISDFKGVIEYVNPGFEQVIGYSAEQVIGRRPYFFLKDLADPELIRKMGKVLRTGKQWRGRLKNRSKSGKIFNLDTVISPVYGPGKRIIKLVAVANDVTREIELQAQLHHSQKLEAIGKLSASIAHEFGNPLLGVRFAIRDLKKRLALSVDDRKMMDLAESECDRMKKLIRDLQRFNRPASGEKTRFDLHSLLDDILLFHRRFFISKRVKLITDYDPAMLEIVAIEDQVRQVFINLVINACEAMGDNGGTITVTTRFRDDDVVISIRDTGTGITDQDRAHIFEPFFTTKPEVEGTGLGLSVSYGIVSTHGGDITVDSEPGQGTVFTVTLPIA